MSNVLVQPPAAHASPRQGAPPYAAYPPPVREASGDRVDLRRVLAVLRPHAALIAVLTLLTAGATAFLLSREVPVYRAKAVVQVVDSRNVLPKEFGQQTAEQAGGDQRSDPVLSQMMVLDRKSVV